MAKKPLDYEGEIEIDPEALDVEWINQPMLFMKYARNEAEMGEALDKAIENVKIIRSELIKEAHETLPKATGPVVESYYRDHKDHKEAKEAVITAQFNYNIARSAVFAFNQRKVALENLVRLHGQSYFAGPSEPRDLPAEASRVRESKRQAAGERAKGKIKKRKRD